MYDNEEMAKIVGQTPVSVEGATEGSDVVVIKTAEGNSLKLRYEPDCCASCSVCQVDGDIEDLIGVPLVMCEEITDGVPEHDQKTETGQGYEDESFTWTFVKLGTVKGYVTIRWYGSSNGYYSEAPTAFYEPDSCERLTFAVTPETKANV